MKTLIDCECGGSGYTNAWVSPDGDYDFERCECNVCYFSAIEETSYPVNIATLCATHYQEWSDEKNMGEYYE